MGTFLPIMFRDKDSFNVLINLGKEGEEDLAGEEAAPSAGGATTIGGKYVPPSMRAGARGAGESMRRPGGVGRDDLPTLRVSNLSQDASDADVRDLFSRFGRVERVYIGRDRDTGIGKGFAFVSFEDREVADTARQKVDGLGYDNLILKCAWSREFGFFSLYFWTLVRKLT